MKNLSTAIQDKIDPLENKLEYMNIKKTLQAQSTQCTWALQAPATNRLIEALSSLVIRIPQFRLIASTIQWLLLMLPKGTKTSLNTQNKWGKCLG